jgi:hypothetical protein
MAGVSIFPAHGIDELLEVIHHGRLFRVRPLAQGLFEILLQGVGDFLGKNSAVFCRIDQDTSTVGGTALPADEVFVFQPIEYAHHRTGAEVNLFGELIGRHVNTVGDGPQAHQLGAGNLVLRRKPAGIDSDHPNQLSDGLQQPMDEGWLTCTNSAIRLTRVEIFNIQAGIGISYGSMKKETRNGSICSKYRNQQIKISWPFDIGNDFGR